MTYLMVFMRCFCIFFSSSDFLYDPNVVGTHLNYIDKSMQFKRVPTKFEDYGIASLWAYRGMCSN